MNYVLHICKNKDCNNGWLDKDLTKVKSFPPSWKYCRECCIKLGIDFDKQTPSSNREEKDNLIIEEKIEKMNSKKKSK